MSVNFLLGCALCCFGSIINLFMTFNLCFAFDQFNQALDFKVDLYLYPFQGRLKGLWGYVLAPPSAGRSWWLLLKSTWWNVRICFSLTLSGSPWRQIHPASSHCAKLLWRPRNRINVTDRYVTVSLSYIGEAGPDLRFKIFSCMQYVVMCTTLGIVTATALWLFLMRATAVTERINDLHSRCVFCSFIATSGCLLVTVRWSTKNIRNATCSFSVGYNPQSP